jgi:glycosyltransferase involved in cell wall biosynthesis
MTVSVVICAYTLDRWDQLVAAVKSCADQSLVPDELILVVDYNDELLERSEREISNSKVVANRSTKGLSGARNTGIAVSKGDVVVFLDDDAYADSRWLENILRPFNNDSVAGVGGWIIPSFDGPTPAWFPETFYWILGCSYKGLPPSGSMIRNPIGANMALRRRVFASVGGFTTGLGRVGKIPLGCEETELCIRYRATHPGEYFILQGDALVHHRVPATRLNWHYFWTRCWAEGISKATVTSLAGSNSGLSAERRHVLRSIPKELFENLRLFRRHPGTSAKRSFLVMAGTGCAILGWLWGSMAVRGTRLVRGNVDMVFEDPAAPNNDIANAPE